MAGSGGDREVSGDDTFGGTGVSRHAKMRRLTELSTFRSPVDAAALGEESKRRDDRRIARTRIVLYFASRLMALVHSTIKARDCAKELETAIRTVCERDYNTDAARESAYVTMTTTLADVMGSSTAVAAYVQGNFSPADVADSIATMTRGGHTSEDVRALQQRRAASTEIAVSSAPFCPRCGKLIAPDVMTYSHWGPTNEHRDHCICISEPVLVRPPVQKGFACTVVCDTNHAAGVDAEVETPGGFSLGPTPAGSPTTTRSESMSSCSASTLSASEDSEP